MHRVAEERGAADEARTAILSARVRNEPDDTGRPEDIAASRRRPDPSGKDRNEERVIETVRRSVIPSSVSLIPSGPPTK